MLFLYQKGSNISVTSFILLRFILEVPTHCPVIMYEFVIDTKNNDKTFVRLSTVYDTCRWLCMIHVDSYCQVILGEVFFNMFVL